MADNRVVVLGLEATGLVVASCLAGPACPVVAVEPDRVRRQALQQGRLPFFEPGLEALFREAVGCGWLELVDEPPSCARVFCVATDPPDPAVEALLARATAGSVLALQVPVPVGTAERLEDRVRELRGAESAVGVVSNPLLLRRGQAVRDFLRPRWVLLGGEWRWAVDAVADLYRGTGALVVRTDHRTAEATGQLAEDLPEAYAAVLDQFRRLSESWGADFELLRRLVLSEVTDGAFRRYVHTAAGRPGAARPGVGLAGAAQLMAR